MSNIYPHKFPYEWNLKDAIFTKDKGTVFSCFACGGGSTMGYKLAGFDVIGCNEIDERMFKIYKANHNPKFGFLEPIQDFAKREEYPQELYSLDILDGSPPCSSFSMSGLREDAWGKMKKFREGQVEQVLDTLFFDFIGLAKKLKPKVVVAENVKGLLQGEARDYVRSIYRDFDDAGYVCQHFLLNSMRMGVPQKRERVFFICLRKDLCNLIPQRHNLFENIPILELSFNESPIYFKEFADYQGADIGNGKIREYWDKRRPTDNNLGDTTAREYGKCVCFNNRLDKEQEVCYTLTATSNTICYEQPKYHSKGEILRISTFPLDYDFIDQKEGYVCGMSVPPVMMAHIAASIYDQWLSKIKQCV